MSRNQIFIIQNSLDKLQSLDPDLRFMGFSDLHGLLSNKDVETTLSEEPHLTANVCRAILDKLDDSITEVQNQAVKCLEPLVQRIGDRELQGIVNAFNDKLNSNRDTNISIYSMALSTVILSSKATESVAHILANSLLSMLQDLAIDQWTAEDMEILIDLIRRYGSSFSSNELSSAQNLLFKLLQDGRGLARRRAVIAIGFLSRYLNSAKWDSLITFLINGLQASSKNNKLRIFIRLTATLSKYDSVRFRAVVKNVFKYLYSALFPNSNSSNDDNSDQSDELLECQEEILSAFENIVLCQPAEASLHLDELLYASQNFIKYDPNYNMDESGENSDAEASSDFGDDYGSELEEEEFSDDEDQSWKLRRSAVKLASALALSNQSQLPFIYSGLLNPMISRFSIEREDTVKVELVKTLRSFISLGSYDATYYKSKDIERQNGLGRRGSDASMMTEGDPQSILSEISSKLIHLALNAVEKSSTAVAEYPTLLISMLKELLDTCSVSDADVISIIECLVRLSKTKPAFMTDILQLTESVLSGDHVIDDKAFEKLSSLILLGIEDAYYKTSSEGLYACLCLLDKLRSEPNILISLIPQLHPIIVEKALSNSLDMECRERAIKAIGKMCLITVPEQILEKSCSCLQTLMSNEILRLQSLDAASNIIGSINNIPENWVVALAGSITSLFNIRQKAVRSAALTCIDLLIPRMIQFSMETQTETAACSIIDRITSDKSFFNEDSQLLDLAVNVLGKLWPIVSQEASICSKLVDYGVFLLDVDAVTNAEDVNTAQISSERGNINSLHQKLPQDIVNFISEITSNYDTAQIQEFYDKVVSGSSKTDVRAHVVARLIHRGNLKDVIVKYGEIISSRDKHSVQDVEWSLSVYGYLGQQDGQIDEHSIGLLYEVLKDSKEKIRVKGAKSLGIIISHHMEYMNGLLENLQQNNSNPYLHLLVLKQAIFMASSISYDRSNLVKESGNIWNHLFALCSNDDMGIDDGTTNKQASGNDLNEIHAIIGECVGALSALNPSQSLEALREYWKSDNRSYRAIALDALKYLFDAASGEDNNSVTFDEVLRPVINDVQELLDDPDVTIRARSLGVLVSALHRQPDTLLPYLDKLLSHVSKETVKDPALVRTIQMGPFKHKVDDGLELRKIAFEAIWTITNTFSSQKVKQSPLISTVVKRVIDGFSDEHEIRILCLFIIGRLAQIDLQLVTTDRKLDHIVKNFTDLLSVTIKENTIKQEVEKQSEIIRNVVRTSSVINKEINSAKATGLLGMSDVELKIWTDFYHYIEQKYREIIV